MSLLAKLVGQRLPLAEIVTARAGVSLVFCWWLLRRAGTPLWGHHRGLLVLRGVLSTITLACFFEAAIRLPLAEATVLLYTNTILIAVLAAIFLGEPLTLRVMGSIALGFAGVIVTTRPAMLFGEGTTLDPVGVLIALISALAAACAQVLIRRLRVDEDAMVVTFYFPLVAVLVAVPMMAANFVVPTGTEWLLLLGIGAAGHVAQVELARGMGGRLPAARASVVLYLQIVFAALWGFLVLTERPGGWTIVGGLLILAGTIFATRREPNTSSAPSS